MNTSDNEYDILKKIAKETPNNAELGKTIRKIYKGTFTIIVNGESKEINTNKDYPNDMSLGETIRKIVNLS